MSSKGMVEFRDMEDGKTEAVCGPHDQVIGMIVPHHDGGCAWSFRCNKIVVEFRRAASAADARGEILRCFFAAYGAPQTAAVA